MDTTEKLFYEDTYLKKFTATVLLCEPKDSQYTVVLDRTAFYPEGGGQPADIGTLSSAKVLDVHEKEGIVLHTTDVPLEPGTQVNGAIDWEHRFLLMQQHTGEHIVSGITNRLFKLDNVGFHMGAKNVTVDFNGELKQGNLKQIEALSNAAVYQNVEVRAEYPAPEKLAALEYRSKKELTGAVRIVTVPGYDVCACCGLHTARTGEVGVIKLLSAQRYKGGTRITLMIGSRAVEDYGEKEASVAAISALLSTKQEEVVDAVKHLLTEQTELRQKINTLQDCLFAYKAENVPQGTKSVCKFEENMEPGALRAFCLQLCERAGTAAVFSGCAEEGWKYALGSKMQDVRPLGKKMNTAFSGRGGGKPELVQGSISGTKEELEKFILNA